VLALSKGVLKTVDQGIYAKEPRMTKREAVEKVTRAILRDLGYPEQNWRDHPDQVEAARRLVVALDALGVHRLSG
jgi:hypothetical protein